MGSRTWIKINCDRWFDGTIRQEAIEVRAIWTDLLALAGRTGQDGTIRLPGTEVGYTDGQLAHIFNVPEEVWLKVKDRLRHHPNGEKENRIYVNGGNVIEIINWASYQSEYSRQKGYRHKLHTEVTGVSNTTKCGENRIEKNRSRSLDQDQEKVRSRSASRSRFVPPTIEQVVEYCESRGNNVDPYKWHSYYTANGWRVGRNPMKNWKAAVVTWERGQH